MINLDVEEKKEIDECILDTKCQGDCDEVTHQTQQLQDMRLQGEKRDSPQVEAVLKKGQRCPQCDLVFQKNISLQKHFKEKHGSHFNCPFCHIGFLNQAALSGHINQGHNQTSSVQKTAVRP